MFLLQIQPISVEHGEPPLQQISFRSTSTSCEAKWTSFSKRHRLVRLMSADLLYCTLGRTCFCFQSQEEKVVSVLDDGCGVERNSQLSLLKCRKKKITARLWMDRGFLHFGPFICPMALVKNKTKPCGCVAPIVVLLALSCTLCVNVLLVCVSYST